MKKITTGEQYGNEANSKVLSTNSRPTCLMPRIKPLQKSKNGSILDNWIKIVHQKHAEPQVTDMIKNPQDWRNMQNILLDKEDYNRRTWQAHIHSNCPISLHHQAKKILELSGRKQIECQFDQEEWSMTTWFTKYEPWKFL